MKTSEVRAAFLAMPLDTQLLATSLVLNEAAVEEADGNPARMFDLIAEDPDRLVHLGNLVERGGKASWRHLETVEEEPAEVSTEISTPEPTPKPATPKAETPEEGGADNDLLRQIYGKSIADGSMHVPK